MTCYGHPFFKNLVFLEKNEKHYSKKVVDEHCTDEFLNFIQEEQIDEWSGGFVMVRYIGWRKIYNCKQEWMSKLNL